MNKKELIDKIESLPSLTSITSIRPYVDKKIVLGLISQLDEPQKVVVPQFVADWIKYCKNTFLSLARALMIEEVDFYNYANQEDHSRLIDFFGSGINQETFARAWLDGYEVEKEKRYLVKMKGIEKEKCYLNYNFGGVWLFYNQENFYGYRAHHTRKELEEAGFGEVFNSPLFEVQEVE